MGKKTLPSLQRRADEPDERHQADRRQQPEHDVQSDCPSLHAASRVRAIARTCTTVTSTMITTSAHPTADAYPMSPVSNPQANRYITMVIPRPPGPVVCPNS